MRARMLLMAMAPLILVILAFALAYANGSNDVSKGIATLVGSGVADFKSAVAWGAAWTVAGALVAAFASQGLVATFSGKGFLARPIEGAGFLAAVSIAAIAWVLFASRTGLPVSTTHVSSGAIIGIGLHRGSGSVAWKTVREMALAWLVTLPAAGLLAAGIFAMLR
jgi:inorganic phosphate transporter, PiT family